MLRILEAQATHLKFALRQQLLHHRGIRQAEGVYCWLLLVLLMSLHNRVPRIRLPLQLQAFFV